MTTTTELESAANRRYIRKVTASSLIGNTLEYYDFLVFGTASALVFPKLFFPTGNAFVSSLVALLGFAVGFFARPLGGLFFGRRGDQHGRKSTLIVTLTIMGLGTFAVGLLPTYDSIGIWAPIALVLLRIVQGFAVGGEWGGSMIIVLESAPPSRRGFYSALPNTGGFTAQLLITGVFAIILTLPEDQLLSWGWRIPFLASIVVLGVGIYIRRSLSETPVFTRAREEEAAAERLVQAGGAGPLPDDEPVAPPADEAVAQAKKHRGPLASVFLDDWRSLLIILGLRFAEALPYFLLTVFALSYVRNNDLGVSAQQLQISILIASVIALPMHGVFGRLSDRYGRRPVYLFGAVMIFVTALPFFGMLLSGSFLLVTLGYILVLNLGHNAINAVQPALFAELFPADRRYSGAAAGREIASILTGGLTPFIATALVGEDGTRWPLVVAYVMLGAVFTMIAVKVAPETFQRDLSQVGSYT